MKKKTIHVLSEEPDAFGVHRKALCGRYNPEHLVASVLVNLEQRGVRKPMIREDDDSDAVLPEFEVCGRCLESMRARARSEQWKYEDREDSPS